MYLCIDTSPLQTKSYKSPSLMPAMERDRRRIPDISQQSPAVDFIENRLRNCHPMFAENHCHYDSAVQSFVPNGNPQIIVQSINDDDLYDGKLQQFSAPSSQIAPRPVYTDQKAMIFWNAIFAKSMESFKLYPLGSKRATEYGFDIRDKGNWESVYGTLEAAKNRYCQEKSVRGRFRKNWRRLADNISPIAETARIAKIVAPDNMYSTPVLGAVTVIMDAMQVATDRRKQALGVADVDKLEARFSDIQLFVGMFPEDEHIRRASTELTISILNAVEHTIAFFIANEFGKAGKAIFTGDNYGQMLVQSIQKIDMDSKSLHTEATKSHMHQSQLYDEQLKKNQDQMLSEQANISEGLNGMKDLLIEHELRIMSRIEGLRHYFERAPSPDMQAMGYYMSQDALHHMIDAHDIDIQDITSISSMKSGFLSRELAQAEQVIQMAKFRQWLVLPTSTKLLLHWEPRPSRFIGDISPFSIMCSMMMGLLKSQPRFLPLIFFGAKYVERVRENPWGYPHIMLRSLIDQLLRQHRFDMRLISHVADPTRFENMFQILELLIYQLPNTRTLCCIIDGVVLLEREEHSREALTVLAKLLEISNRQNTQAPVKLLFTSTPATTIVRKAFEDEDLILNVSTLRPSGLTPSVERMARELGQNAFDAEGAYLR